MLAYLGLLCEALTARDRDAILRLLRHPLAKALPRRVREEGYAIARAGTDGRRPPFLSLHFYHQTAQLMRVPGEPDAHPWMMERPLPPQGKGPQLELELKQA